MLGAAWFVVDPGSNKMQTKLNILKTPSLQIMADLNGSVGLALWSV